MKYHYLVTDKKNGYSVICSSMVKVYLCTNISLDTLYYQFTRKKREHYTLETYDIQKLEFYNRKK